MEKKYIHKHIFYLCKGKDCIEHAVKGSLKNYEGLIDSLDVPDNIIEYLGDTLNWIPDIQYANGKLGVGLDLCAVNIFTMNSVIYFNNISNKWRSLFSLAPDYFELTGECYSTNEEVEGNDEGYEMIEVYKKDLLALLGKIINLTERAKNNENYFLIHRGL